MTTNAPVSHLVDAQGLESDAKIDLWEIRLRGVPTIFRFWNGVTREWQGETYEGLPCQLSGEARNSEGQQSRPSLTVVNPEKVFGVFAAAGYFDLAEIIRKRVLQAHFVGNVNEYEQRVWIVSRPSSVLSQTMSLELRSPLDMPSHKTPARTFSPPEFPFVTI